MSVKLIRALVCDVAGDSEYIPPISAHNEAQLRRYAHDAGWTRTPGKYGHRLDVCPRCAPAETDGHAAAAPVADRRPDTATPRDEENNRG